MSLREIVNMTLLSQTVLLKKNKFSSYQQQILTTFCRFFTIYRGFFAFYQTAVFLPKTIKIVDLCEARSHP